MQLSLQRRAVDAAIGTVSALGLRADDAAVLQSSNRIAVRLTPCDVLARVTTERHRRGQEFEVGMAQLIAETDSPVATLEPRVEPSVYERDGFVMTFWTYYPTRSSVAVEPREYASALRRLHAGLKTVDPPVPHFTDRVAEARQLVAHPDLTPDLGDADRHVLNEALETMVEAIGRRGATEQLLHGEPHPGNMLATREGLLFIDLETSCRGPVEFDVAHVPEDVGGRYPDLDPVLLRHCRTLMLAMITTWRWDRHDQFPDGRRLGREWLQDLRAELDR